ncbi:MAG: hypothetical protein ACQES9_01845 [Myxococcota bacterium]
MKSIVISILTFLLATLIIVPNARGDNKVKCTTYSILAKEEKGTYSKSLKKFKHIFKKMPFKIYKSFKLLNKNKLALSNREKVAKIGSNLKLSIKLLDRILSSDNKTRYRIKLRILKKKENKKKYSTIYSMVMKLSGDKPMFLAGPQKGGGTLVIGLICQ